MLEFELVLPCYNESKSLEALVRRGAAAAQNAGFTSDRFQLVLVENGSKDASSEVMDQLKTTELGAWFRKVPVQVNRGYGFGLWTGLQSTTAPIVSWSHADQQCDPADAFRGLAILRETGNVEGTLVKGTRSGRDWKDVFVSKVFAAFARVILGASFHEINAQPKVFHRSLLSKLGNPPNTFAFDLYVLYHAFKQGMKIVTIPVVFPPRVHGLSNWASTFTGRYRTILGMIRYMWDLSKMEGRV
jgi:glycosyltransferase involved in cell wall biosynthesis